jgi:archaeosortase B (VPXXXP-CTERM-specific)
MIERLPIVRAWLTLAGTIGAFLILQPFLLLVGFTRLANEITAQLLALTLTLLGNPSSVEGSIVRSELFSLEIIFECTAILPIVLFVAAIAATPSSLKAKLWALGWGLPAIVLFNLIRLVSLVYIGHFAPAAFERVHLLIWQPLTILFALALWLLWVERRRA